MAIGTRSLPTDSSVPYFQLIERGHMSEGGLSDIDSSKAIFVGGVQMSSHDDNVPLGGIKYPPVAAEPGTYTGLNDDYDTLFKARHGRGALEHVPVTSREVVSNSSGGRTPAPSSTGMIVNPRTEVGPTFNNGSLHPNQRGCIPMGTDLSEMGHRVVSPNSGHIIGEGATIFMDMTETMLDALSTEIQKPESSLTDNTLINGQIRSQMTSDTKDIYPDLYLPVVENYRIGDTFHGYSDSLSADNNPMVLVELKGLSY